jgi:hypothetical protein
VIFGLHRFLDDGIIYPHAGEGNDERF